MDTNCLPQMSCLCLGPKGAGKTHLLTALQDPESIDDTSYSMPTNGTNIFTIHFPTKPVSGASTSAAAATTSTTTTTQGATAAAANAGGARRKTAPKKFIRILEVGGTMAPLWRRFYGNVEKIIYVVDTSNLCQISAAGVLLYSALAEPRLQRTKFLLVLSKMDYAYRQMRNEALLMLQISKLQKEIRQSLQIVEASAVTKQGLDDIYKWLQTA